MNNPLPLTDDESKERIAGILKRFADLCEENGLRYYVVYGTCLGTVRHNGFIPWDDDIDVSLPRADFDRFVALCQQGALPGCELLYPGHPKDYMFYYAKLVDTDTRLENHYMKDLPELGLFIDVFAMDDVRMTPQQMMKYEKTARRWALPIRLSGMKKCWKDGGRIKMLVKRCLWKYATMRGFSHWYEKRQSTIRRLQSKKPAEGAVDCFFVGERAISAHYFGDGALHPFEGFMVRVPEKADEYLTRLYGDWRQLPPEEARVSQHDHIAFMR